MPPPFFFENEEKNLRFQKKKLTKNRIQTKFQPLL